MPVSGCLVTLIFSDGDYDISETHISVGAADIAPTIPKALTLLKARNQLMAPGVSPRYVRLSMAGIFRDSEILDLNQLGSVGNPPATYVTLQGQTITVTPDQAKVALAVRMEQSTVSRRTLFMSGLPAGLITQAPGKPLAIQYPAWYEAFLVWQSAIQDGIWGFVARTRGVSAPVPQPISGFVIQQGTGLIGVVTNLAVAGLLQNSTAVVSRQTRKNVAFKPLNGLWQVDSVGTTGNPVQQVYYLTNSSLVDPSTIIKKGYIGGVDFSAYPYVKSSIRNETTRKRGNRALVGPGRKLVRKYL